MKILVVGGAGYIGSICTELLLDDLMKAMRLPSSIISAKAIAVLWIRARDSSRAIWLTASK